MLRYSAVFIIASSFFRGGAKSRYAIEEEDVVIRIASWATRKARDLDLCPETRILMSLK